MMIFVLTSTSLLVFVVALALSFALGPFAIVLGLASLALAPLLALRVAALFSDRASRVSVLSILISAWSALGLGFGLLRSLGVSITQGDAFDPVWMLGMATAIAVGAVVGGFLSSGVLERTG
jgi:hypothetical protein